MIDELKVNAEMMASVAAMMERGWIQCLGIGRHVNLLLSIFVAEPDV